MMANSTVVRAQPAPLAAARRPARRALAPCAQRQQAQGAAAAPAAAGVDRRELLLGAGAVLAGTALQQGSPAVAAADCEFQTAPNGLQWCDVKVGEGESPEAGAMIRAHYTGRLQSNGAVFDSSYERGRPLQFKIGVGQVIRGWDQGILGGEGVPPMKEGGKRVLIIPSDLAYGDRGAGGVIPPKATLNFEVELLGKRTR